MASSRLKDASNLLTDQCSYGLLFGVSLGILASFTHLAWYGLHLINIKIFPLLYQAQYYASRRR
jgi:hypothetical protein